MYADDTSLHNAFRTSHELKEEIIPAFSKVCKWLRNNKLSLNTIKTEFMIIGTLPRLNQLDSSQESTPYAIVVDGQWAKRVKLVKYLGLMVDDKLVWEQHIGYISSKIIRGIGILKRIRHFIPRDFLLLLYHTLIEPYFRYYSIVWGQCGETLKDKLQTLQNIAAWTIAKLRYDEAIHYELLTEFGWLSVRNLINLDTAIFAYKDINNLHPEQADSPFQRLDYLHSYSTRSISNNNLFIPLGKQIIFRKLWHLQEARYGKKSLKKLEWHKHFIVSRNIQRNILPNSRHSHHDSLIRFPCRGVGTFITWEVSLS